MKKTLKILIPVLLVLIAGAVLLIWNKGNNISTDETVNESMREWTGEIKDIGMPSNNSYVTETDYTGNVPYIFYEFPFKKSDNYVMNKDLDPTNERTDQMEESVEQFLSAIMGTGYRKIQEDVKNYKEQYQSVCSPVLFAIRNGEFVNVSEMADETAEYFITNHIVIETHFSTDHSLIYQDVDDYVRGELDLIIYECDNLEDLQEKLSWYFTDIGTLELGKTYSFIADVSLISNGEETEVLNIEILDNISQ